MILDGDKMTDQERKALLEEINNNHEQFMRDEFPKLAKRLGIVYTPLEVVDFMIQSVDYALRQEFGVGLTDQGVHILDPFTGTGTFIVRLLQSGLIEPEDLERKYQSEIEACEIEPLTFDIAKENIKATYQELTGKDEEFQGIHLVDTFTITP